MTIHRIQPNIKERLEEILNDGILRGYWKTKTEFAQVMGITPQILSNVLSPTMDREVPKSLMMGLARVNYNITWFLYGTGPHRNPSQGEGESELLRAWIEFMKE